MDRIVLLSPGNKKKNLTRFKKYAILNYMTHEEFFKSIENTYKEGLEITRTKNHDYASNEDPFKNFSSASVVGITPDRAILVRVLDKLSRVSNLLDKDARVHEESVNDTIIDAINYLAILKAYREATRMPF
jgi:hypothetical protein